MILRLFTNNALPSADIARTGAIENAAESAAATAARSAATETVADPARPTNEARDARRTTIATPPAGATGNASARTDTLEETGAPNGIGTVIAVRPGAMPGEMTMIAACGGEATETSSTTAGVVAATEMMNSPGVSSVPGALARPPKSASRPLI